MSLYKILPLHNHIKRVEGIYSKISDPFRFQKHTEVDVSRNKQQYYSNDLLGRCIRLRNVIFKWNKNTPQSKFALKGLRIFFLKSKVIWVSSVIGRDGGSRDYTSFPVWRGAWWDLHVTADAAKEKTFHPR